MSTREQKQEVLKDWLINHPGHLKTSFHKLGSRFSLSYEDVKEIVGEVKDYFKNKKTWYNTGAAVKAIPADVKFKTENTSELADLFMKFLIENGLHEKNFVEDFTKDDVLAVKVNLDLPPVEPFFGGDPNNVLVIGDTHIPFEREGYLEHCRAVQEKYNCGTVVHIGDVIDNNYSSYHETNPDGKSAGDELSLAIRRLQRWYYTFPNVKVCLGNHDQIIQRKAYTAGLSKRWIKGLAEVLEVPTWDFNLEHHIRDVIYTHGTGTSGDKAVVTRSLNRRKSMVSGHLHTTASITWNVSEVDRIFAMNVGCGIDDAQYSFDYAKTFAKKSIIACGVVLNGELPIIVPMNL